MMAKAPPPIKTVVTYLEQLHRPKLFYPMPVNQHAALMRVSKIPLHFYRYLQIRTGRELHWVARLRLDDNALEKVSMRLRPPSTCSTSMVRRPAFSNCAKQTPKRSIWNISA